MKAILANLCLVLICSANAYSQKDYRPFIKTVEIEGKSVDILRVPDEELTNGYTKNDIGRMQRTLEKNYNLMLAQKATELSEWDELNCKYIFQWDSLYPVQYYRAELEAYALYNIGQKKRDEDSAVVRRERREDSVRVAKYKEGYIWVNSDTAWVYTNPSLKSQKMGSTYRLSYVRGYVVEDLPEWVEVVFENITGYMLKEDLRGKWEDMDLDEEELVELKRGRYYDFTPTKAYKAKLAKEAADEQRSLRAANSAPGRTYYRGPKGGCYFINSKGNKQYVDHSLCK